MSRFVRSRTLRGVAGWLLAVTLLAALTALVSGLGWRVDATADRLHTLSDGARSVLAGLTRDVTVRLYVSGGDSVPIHVRQYAARVEELLREMARAAGGRLAVERVDPRPDSPEEEWARRYGIHGQPLNPLDPDAILYFGVVALSGTRESAIPVLSPHTEPQLEYHLVRRIAEVGAGRRPRIGVWSSLPVDGGRFPFPRMPGRPPAEPPRWILLDEMRALFDVEILENGAERIPGDLAAVLLIHPRNLSEPDLFALDQFVLEGGRLIAFLDPLCLAQLETLPDTASFGPVGAASDLNRLTSAWGATMETDRVAADPGAATPLHNPAGAVERHAAWLSLRKGNLDRDDVITAPLDLLEIPFGGAFRLDPVEGVRSAVLAKTSDAGGWMDAMSLMMGGGGGRPPRPEPEPLALAVRLDGRFPTAFPEGRPATDGEPLENEAEGDPARPEPGGEARDGFLRASRERSVAVLIGDVDLLYDRFAVDEIPFHGQTIYRPRNDNLNFALNLVEQMAGSDALIGLRSRGTFERPFTRVLALEQAARERWRIEENLLTERLEETRRRIRELQADRDPSQQFIITPEQRAEIERFQREQFETQRQLREVRRNLRRDIERLGLVLKTLNLAAVPLAVALFGLVHGSVRRRRSGRA